MKRTLFLLIAMLITLSSTLDAQIHYRIEKYRHDFHDYTPKWDDEYNVGLCGVASFFVPGLGQIIARETPRGLAFMAGNVVSYAAFVTGTIMVSENSSYSSTYETGTIILLAGLIGGVVIPIWSATDAVRVAKVRNMAINALEKSKILFKPSLGISPSGDPAPGIGLVLNF